MEPARRLPVSSLKPGTVSAIGHSPHHLKIQREQLCQCRSAGRLRLDLGLAEQVRRRQAHPEKLSLHLSTSVLARGRRPAPAGSGCRFRGAPCSGVVMAEDFAFAAHQGPHHGFSWFRLQGFLVLGAPGGLFSGKKLFRKMSQARPCASRRVCPRRTAGCRASDREFSASESSSRLGPGPYPVYRQKDPERLRNSDRGVSRAEYRPNDARGVFGSR